MAMVGIDMTKAWNQWAITDCHWDVAAKLLAVLKNMPEIEAGPEYHGVRWKHGDVQASMRGNFIRFEGDPKAMIDKISAALSARQPPVKHIMMTKKIRDIEFAPKFYPNLFEMFDVKAANIAAWKAHNAHLLDPAPNVTANADPPPMQQLPVVQMRAAGPGGAPASAGRGGAGGPAPPLGINDMMNECMCKIHINLITQTSFTVLCAVRLEHRHHAGTRAPAGAQDAGRQRASHVALPRQVHHQGRPEGKLKSPTFQAFVNSI